MTPDEIDRILDESANHGISAQAGRAAVERAQNAILSDLRPVRPMAAAWVYALAFALMFAALSTASAFVLGLNGFHALGVEQRILIFPALLAAAGLGAFACARAMRPAEGTRLGVATLLLSAGVFPLVFLLAFHDYSTANFVAEGVPCLLAGLYVAVPTGLGTAWILRRGFVLDWASAGLAAGVLAGLTGIGMLELHCPNPKAIHVMVWHVAVVVVSAALGFAIGRFADAIRRRARI